MHEVFEWLGYLLVVESFLFTLEQCNRAYMICRLHRYSKVVRMIGLLRMSSKIGSLHSRLDMLFGSLGMRLGKQFGMLLRK